MLPLAFMFVYICVTYLVYIMTFHMVSCMFCVYIYIYFPCITIHISSILYSCNIYCHISHVTFDFHVVYIYVIYYIKQHVFLHGFMCTYMLCICIHFSHVVSLGLLHVLTLGWHSLPGGFTLQSWVLSVSFRRVF